MAQDDQPNRNVLTFCNTTRSAPQGPLDMFSLDMFHELFHVT